jgi:hypothetical protein
MLLPVRFASCLQDWKQKLLEAGYDAIVYEDPLDMLLQQVHAILIGPTGEGLAAALAGQLACSSTLSHELSVLDCICHQQDSLPGCICLPYIRVLMVV